MPRVQTTAGSPGRSVRTASARAGLARTPPSLREHWSASEPSSRPFASKAAVIPVLAARTSGRPSSTARSRAAARCWRGPVELPNQASLVMLTSQSGRSCLVHQLRRVDRLVADQPAERRQAGHVEAFSGRCRTRTRGRAPSGPRTAPNSARTRRTAPGATCRRCRRSRPARSARTCCCRARPPRPKRMLPASTAVAGRAACQIASRALASRPSRYGLADSGHTTTTAVRAPAAPARRPVRVRAR